MLIFFSGAALVQQAGSQWCEQMSACKLVANMSVTLKVDVGLEMSKILLNLL